MTFGPCMCGATDCPSCGPAQGYTVKRRWSHGRGWFYYNPEDGEDEEEDIDPPDPDQYYEN